MKLTIVPPRVSNNFTQVPNEILFSAALTDHQKVVWMSLRGACNGTQDAVFYGTSDLAHRLDAPIRSLQRDIKALIDFGYITKQGNQLHLEVEPVEPENGEIKTAVKKKPKLSPRQQLRQELTDTWNNKKPDNFPAMRGPLQEARLDVLLQHAEMVDCKDLSAFLGRVLLACKMNDWYKKVPQTFENIFGTGTPTTKKLEKTQKMYQEAQGKKAEAAGFDRNDDQSWLDWFASKGHTQFTKVERIEMERFAAWKHETDEGAEDTLYIYNEGTTLVHWTYKESQCGVSYLPAAS